MKLLTRLLPCFVILAGCASHFDAANATGFQTLSHKDSNYWAYVPNDAAAREARGELMPVLVYLHDADARGDEAEQATQDGLGAIVAKTNGAYPLVVLFPTLKKGAWSDPLAEAALVRQIEDALHRVGGDPDRVYVTGVGLGATGVWQLAATQPGRFAAIVPVGGAADAKLASAIGALPVWAFSGDHPADKALVDALGASAKHTKLSGSGTSLAGKAYAEPTLVEWLLAQKRSSAPPPASPAPASN